jgi:acyl CoA:acetate/3-ketoacid CoA transferase beta subunit
MSAIGDICAVACAEVFRGDGRRMISPMGPLPKLGARLAQATFSPDIVLTDGVASIVDHTGRIEGWMPFSRVFDTLWNGMRHVMMGATQIDQHGNSNISALGDFARPKVQLLGVRGAPGNTVYHPTSYFIGAHSSRVFVPRVDVVSGVGPSRGAHEIRAVVTNLGVFHFDNADGVMAVRSLHPGITADAVQASTGFPLQFPSEVPQTPAPTPAQTEWLDRLDPGGAIRRSIQ